MKPSHIDFVEAARLARLSIPLDVAMSIPALAYCLKQTAMCVAKKRLSTQPVAPDFKKLAAGDSD